MTKVVAIHQPSFFPWLGYFDKIARCDTFVFFDDVQFPKTGGTWTNRVKVLIASEAKWLTASIDRQYHGTRRINEMTFLPNNPWRTKILKSIETEYRRHPYYAETMDILNPLLMNPENNIAEYNIHAVTALALALGLDTSKLRRSSAYPTTGSATKLLCSLTQAVGADIYLCGGGADGYQDNAIFGAHGIVLRYQRFHHPTYPQHQRMSFMPGLSIVDAAMNLGFGALGSLLRTSNTNNY
jgi:hypothetical protein